MNLAEFEGKWNKEGKTEEGTIRLFLIGVLEYLDDNKDAEKMIAMTLPKNQLDKNTKYYLTSQFSKTKNIAASYLGGTPDNEYKYSYDSKLEIGKQSDKGDKKSKIFVQSGGKTSGSPVHLQKNKNGYWKLFNVSSLATGVMKSKSEQDAADDF